MLYAHARARAFILVVLQRAGERMRAPYAPEWRLMRFSHSLASTLFLCVYVLTRPVLFARGGLGGGGEGVVRHHVMMMMISVRGKYMRHTQSRRRRRCRLAIANKYL